MDTVLKNANFNFMLVRKQTHKNVECTIITTTRIIAGKFVKNCLQTSAKYYQRNSDLGRN